MSRLARVLAPLQVGLLLAAAACGPAGSAATVERSSASDGATSGAATSAAADLPDSVVEGIRLYHAEYCGTCHTNSLAGTAGTFGPTHDGLRATAEKRIHDSGYTGKARSPEAYVRESIREPGAYRVPGFEHTRFLMPAYTQLTDEEVNALVGMLLWNPPSEAKRP